MAITERGWVGAKGHQPQHAVTKRMKFLLDSLVKLSLLRLVPRRAGHNRAPNLICGTDTGTANYTK